MLPPTNFRVSVVGNLLTFRWDPPSGGLAPTHYEIEAGLSPGGTVASLATPNSDPILVVGAPDGVYYVRVYAESSAMRSGPSTEIPVYVGVPVAPSPPANLLAVVNGSSVALSWRNTFGGGAAAAILIEATGAVNTSLPFPLAEMASFATVPAGTYTIRVRGVNAGGTSGPSNAVTLTVPTPCTGAPQPPANVLAYRLNHVIFVRWDPPTGGTAVTSYSLNVSGAFNTSLSTTGRELFGAVGPGAYTFTVTAVNPCGASAPTPSQTVVIP